MRQFQDIPGWPGYRVSDDGIIESCRDTQGRIGVCWRRKATFTDKDGYKKMTVHYCGKMWFVGVNVLVLLAFTDHRPRGAFALHGNGDPSDNLLSNLRWGTAKDNADDRAKHGNTACGFRNGRTKATPAVLCRIHTLRSEGVSYGRIATDVGLSKRQVMRIAKGEAFPEFVPKQKESVA